MPLIIITDRKIAYLFPQDLRNAPDLLIELYEKWDIRSIVLSPMQLQGQHFGFLILFSRQRNQRWAPEDTTIRQALTSTFLTGECSMQAAKRLQTAKPAEPQQPDEDADDQ